LHSDRVARAVMINVQENTDQRRARDGSAPPTETRLASDRFGHRTPRRLRGPIVNRQCLRVPHAIPVHASILTQYSSINILRPQSTSRDAICANILTLEQRASFDYARITREMYRCKVGAHFLSSRFIRNLGG
jgi:hypothetical protein